MSSRLQWLATVSPTMRETHAAGEKLFVGMRHGASVRPGNGEERWDHIFVAGASNYAYAERVYIGLRIWLKGQEHSRFAGVAARQRSKSLSEARHLFARESRQRTLFNATAPRG